MPYLLDHKPAVGAVSVPEPILWGLTVVAIGALAFFLLPRKTTRKKRKKSWLSHQTRPRRECAVRKKAPKHTLITC